MRRPPKPVIPQDNASPEGIRQAVLREMRRVVPLQSLIYKPTVSIRHTGPYSLVVTVHGLHHLTVAQYLALKNAMDNQRSVGAECVLVLDHKRG
jgi:hypothetical protein